jgi:hypothetical protein
VFLSLSCIFQNCFHFFLRNKAKTGRFLYILYKNFFVFCGRWVILVVFFSPISVMCIVKGFHVTSVYWMLKLSWGVTALLLMALLRAFWMRRACENDKYSTFQGKYYPSICTDRLRETIKQTRARIINNAWYSSHLATELIVMCHGPPDKFSMRVLQTFSAHRSFSIIRNIDSAIPNLLVNFTDKQ